jgi:hypothetical protein
VKGKTGENATPSCGYPATAWRPTINDGDEVLIRQVNEVRGGTATIAIV